MTLARRAWLAGLLAVVCVVWAKPGRADAADPALTVYVIHGVNAGEGTDASIKDIVRRMGNAASMFDTYRLLKKVSATVAIGSSKTIPVPGNRQIVLKPTGITDGALHIEATVAKRGESGTTVRGQIVDRGTFVFAGYNHDGGQLFFAVNASF